MKKIAGYLPISAFLVAVVVLLFVLLDFTHSNDRHATYAIKALFKDAGGVKRGTPVMMAGMYIGEVRKAALDPANRGVSMMLAINREVRIPVDSVLKVQGKGMLGELYLSFEYGASDQCLQAGAAVEGITPMDLSRVLAAAGETAGSLDSVIGLAGAMNAVLGEPEVQEALRRTLKNLPALSQALRNAAELNGPELHRVLGRVAVLSDNTTKLVAVLEAEARLLQQEKYLEKSGELLVALKETAAKTESLLDEGNKTIAQWKKAGVEAETALAALNHGQGTAGKMLGEHKLHDDLEQLVTNANQLVSELREHPSSLVFGRTKVSAAGTARRPENTETGIEAEQGLIFIQAQGNLEVRK